MNATLLVEWAMSSINVSVQFLLLHEDEYFYNVKWYMHSIMNLCRSIATSSMLIGSASKKSGKRLNKSSLEVRHRFFTSSLLLLGLGSLESPSGICPLPYPFIVLVPSPFVVNSLGSTSCTLINMDNQI